MARFSSRTGRRTEASERRERRLARTSPRRKRRANPRAARGTRTEARRAYTRRPHEQRERRYPMGRASPSTRRESTRTESVSLVRTEEAQFEARAAPIEVRDARIASCEAPRKARESMGSFDEDSPRLRRDPKRVERAKANLGRARYGCA